MLCNLCYVFLVDPEHENILRQQYMVYMACGCSHSSVNKFLGILMGNIEKPEQMENYF